MALSKWFGQPNSSNASSTAGPPQSDRVVAISKAETKQFGLENFGNTCYINSVLQALYFCYPFRELIVQVDDRSNPLASSARHSSSSLPPSNGSSSMRARHQRKASTAEVSKVADGANSNGTPPPAGPPIPPSPPTMFSALRSLFVHISNNSLDKGIVSPRAFVEKLKKENELFRSTMHQDAHEFLIYLLNKIAEDLEEEARNVRSGSISGDGPSSGTPSLGTATSRSNCSVHTNIVHDLFEGILTSETRCLTCETVSSRDEAFLDLSIDIEQNSSVTACLRQFSASEMLCHKNKFFCDSCCGLQEAEKRMKIKRLPNVLALHLKRFKYQDDVGRYIKLAYRVAFPLELRLFNTADDAVDPDRLYELFAIVVHIGNGPHHGHYIAIIKSNDSWFVFDDDSVEPIKESNISKYFGDSNNGAAYVLYYQALDIDLQALGLKVEDPIATESTAQMSPKQAPLLPPGLIHEGDSDASELAPATPASPVMQPVPVVEPSSAPSLTVTIPPPETPLKTPVVTTPTTASPNGNLNGFFGSLRNSPSKASMSQRTRNSTRDETPPPVPPLSSSAAPAPRINSELSQATIATTSHTPNGRPKRPKTPMEKASGWISRKLSARPEKEMVPGGGRRPATVHGSHGMQDHHDGSSFASSSSSSRALFVQDGSLNAHSSSAEIPSLLPAFSVSTKAPSQSPSQDHSPLSNSIVPSQLQNGSVIPPTSPSTNSPLNHNTEHHHHNFHLPGHKKSQPVLSTARPPPSESRKLPAARLPKRPSTASAACSPTHGTFVRIEESPPVPHLPSELRSPTSPIPRSRTIAVPNEEQDRRRLSAHVPSSVPSTPFKRASRKLSVTAGMLGFGRKEKDKHRSEEPPSSSSPPTSASPMLSGLSPHGHL